MKPACERCGFPLYPDGAHETIEVGRMCALFRARVPDTDPAPASPEACPLCGRDSCVCCPMCGDRTGHGGVPCGWPASERPLSRAAAEAIRRTRGRRMAHGADPAELSAMGADGRLPYDQMTDLELALVAVHEGAPRS